MQTILPLNPTFFFVINELRVLQGRLFRLSIGISKESYEKEFGKRAKRPSKGGIIDTDHNFAEVNILMPHPIYGWMSWVQILSPQEETFEKVLPLIAEAHSNAVLKFNKKTASKLLHPQFKAL